MNASLDFLDSLNPGDLVATTVDSSTKLHLVTDPQEADHVRDVGAGAAVQADAGGGGIKMDSPDAFPYLHEHERRDGTERNYCTGMTLRDYFAAKALPVVMQGADIQDSLAWNEWMEKTAESRIRSC